MTDKRDGANAQNISSVAPDSAQGGIERRTPSRVTNDPSQIPSSHQRAATIIQKHIRGHIQRRTVANSHEAAIRIQKIMRGHLDRRRCAQEAHHADRLRKLTAESTKIRRRIRSREGDMQTLHSIGNVREWEDQRSKKAVQTLQTWWGRLLARGIYNYARADRVSITDEGKATDVSDFKNEASAPEGATKLKTEGRRSTYQDIAQFLAANRKQKEVPGPEGALPCPTVYRTNNREHQLLAMMAEVDSLVTYVDQSCTFLGTRLEKSGSLDDEPGMVAPRAPPVTKVNGIDAEDLAHRDTLIARGEWWENTTEEDWAEWVDGCLPLEHFSLKARVR